MIAARPLSLLLGTLVGAATLIAGPAAHAATVVIDAQTVGTVYDSIGDGWFFASTQQPLPAPDGVGDAAQQALGVALKSGVLELRALAEFPLADLEALDPADITSVTLTVTIDDVLSTFGPGADFDGNAAASITAFGYEGDGTIALADFANVAGQPLASIDTTARGTITDASLLSGGPEAFIVDVTARVKTVLAGSATHFGVVMATTDDQSGTSLDALSPPGVAGATLPFLTVTIADAGPSEPPVLGKAALKCQKALAKQAQGYQAAVSKNVAKCFEIVLTTVAKGKPASDLAGKCGAAIDPARVSSKVAAARGKAADAIAKACAGVSPADLGAPCDGAAADLAAVAACTLDAHRDAAEASLRSAYASGCVLLQAIGLPNAFPLVCRPL
jgi:hypothetical protein